MRAGGLTTAFRTLTILPLPGETAAAEGRVAAALPWFPCVGLVLGAGLYGLTMLAGGLPGGGWTEGAAFVVVAGGVLLNRGLHLDGLADAADAWGSFASREKMLSIMKDSRVGTFGVLAIVLALAAKWIAVARLVDSGTAVWIVAAYVVSRTAQVELACALPYAREGGGTAEGCVKGARLPHRLGAWLLAVIMTVVALGPAGAVALFGGWVVARALGWRFVKMFGGVTGDLLGATSEIVEAVVLFACAAAGTSLASWTGWGVVVNMPREGMAG